MERDELNVLEASEIADSNKRVEFTRLSLCWMGFDYSLFQMNRG